jgi:hypothetical protein
VVACQLRCETAKKMEKIVGRIRTERKTSGNEKEKTTTKLA